MMANYEKGDVVYFYYDTTHAFKYYSKVYDFSNINYVLEEDFIINPSINLLDSRVKLQRLKKFNGIKRLWIITHFFSTKFLIEELDKKGNQIDVYSNSVFLYNMNNDKE